MCGCTNAMRSFLALSAALCMVLSLCSVSTDSTGSSAEPQWWSGQGTYYLRNASYGYAMMWYSARNPHYNDFSASGGDCANFVSQALIAGGMSLWQGTDGNGYGVYPDVDRPSTYSNGTIPFCDYLHQHLVNYQPVDYYYVIEGVNATIPPDIAVGDVVIFGEDAVDRWMHAMLVVWVGAGDIGLAAHTTDVWNVSFWTELGYASFDCANFYHIHVELSEPFSFMVRTSTLNVRVGPGTNGLSQYYQDIGDIHSLEMYVAIGAHTDANGNLWYQFWFDERSAWCAAEMASGSVYALMVNQAQFEIDVSTALNVRDGPGTSYAVAGQVYDGARYVTKGMRYDPVGGLYWRSFWWGGMVKWCAASYTFNATSIMKNLTRMNVGFYPYWMGTSYNSLRHELITHLPWFSVEMNSAGDITNYHNWPSGWSALIARCKENGTKLLLTATLFGSSSVSSFLSNSSARSNCISNLLTQTINGNADGIVLDLEYPPSGSDADLATFTQEISAGFKGENLLYEVHFCLMPYPWSSYGYGELSAMNSYLDYYFLMGYDYHYSGSATTGAVGALFWDNDIDAWHAIDRYIHLLGADRKKFVYGVPYFGFDWPVSSAEYNQRAASTTGSGSSRTYDSAMSNLESTGAALQWDAFSQSPWYWYWNGTSYRQVWFDNATSLRFKYQLVNELDLPGMGVWALGYDSPRAELWDAIDEKLGLFCLDVEPANGSVVGGVVNMSIHTYGGVTEAWLNISEGGWQKAIYTTEIHQSHLSQFYHLWDTTTLPDGWHTVQFRLNNSYGWASYENRSYYVQNHYHIPLAQGWNLVSLPLVQPNTTIESVLSSISGEYDRVIWYSPLEGWRQFYTKWDPALNDLTHLNHTMGFWLNVTAPSTTLNTTGNPPVSSAIPLKAGWNLIGYPARNDSSYTVGQLKAATSAAYVEGFDPSATYMTSVLPDSYVLKKGEGYWVYVPADTTWTVDW
ncbi:MAG: glycosyl hydrolase family 18 protein [Candidatus Thermoplasmatota archaeon]